MTSTLQTLRLLTHPGYVWRKLPRGMSKARPLRLMASPEEEIESVVFVPPPEGVTQPKRVPDIPPPSFGFVEKAERWNSRAAMVGFMFILLIELIANRGILQLTGFNVGSGLGFEF